MWATPRATPVRKPEEVHLIDGIQDLDKRSLDDLVFQHRDAQWSLPPIGFRNIRSPCGQRSIRASCQPTSKVLEMGLQVFAILLPRHPIDARSRLRIEAKVGPP